MRPFPPPSPARCLWIGVPRRLVRGAALGLLAALLAGAAVHRPLLAALGERLVVSIPCERADVIVVLAGDRGERLDQAVGLYKRGVAPKLLVSGGPIAGPVTWAEVMRQQALGLGVPAEDVWTQDRSVTTQEDARFCREVLEARGARSLCLVTSNFHTRRALGIFRKALGPGYEISVSPVVPDWWVERPWWRSDLGRLCVFNEYVKAAWDLLYGAEY